MTDDQLFSMDITLAWRGERCAIELDGVQHYTVTLPYRPVGAFHLKAGLPV